MTAGFFLGGGGGSSIVYNYARILYLCQVPNRSAHGLICHLYEASGRLTAAQLWTALLSQEGVDLNTHNTYSSSQ